MTKEDKKMARNSERIIKQGQDLLQQARNVCSVPQIDPINMAFPDVISGNSEQSPAYFNFDVNALYSQQEELFADGLTHSANEEAEPDAGVDSPELQAIKGMYESS